MRTLRIYELDVTYPEAPEEFGVGADDDGADRWWWRWPAQRRFLSRSGAIARAEVLAGLGCRVAVRQSAPIEWDPEPVKRLDPIPPRSTDDR